MTDLPQKNPPVLPTKGRIDRTSPLFKPRPEPPKPTLQILPLNQMASTPMPQVTLTGNLKNLLRIATRRSLHAKRSEWHLICLQWIGCEDLVNDFADWVQGSFYEGPVWAFDSFERQQSMIGSAPRPDNYPAPEPSERLRVSKGYHDVPQPASLLFIGMETPEEVAIREIDAAPEGCIVVTPWQKTSSVRTGHGIVACDDFIGAKLLPA